MKKGFKLGLLLLALGPVSGCAEIHAEIAASCASWERITISKDDVLTDGTASQIKGNNVARDAVCKTKKG